MIYLINILQAIQRVSLPKLENALGRLQIANKLF